MYKFARSAPRALSTLCAMALLTGLGRRAVSSAPVTGVRPSLQQTGQRASSIQSSVPQH